MALDELMDLIVKEIKDSCQIELTLDGLSKNAGTSMELSPGYNESLYYSKNAVIMIPILFLSKDKDQKNCLLRLEEICGHFQAMKKYPVAESFFWLDAVTATYPNKIGRQEDGQYIYSAIVNMKLYIQERTR